MNQSDRAPGAAPARVRILGIPLTAQRFDAAIDRLMDAARGDTTFRAHFCNVHTTVEAQSSEELRDVYESASMVVMDGAPLAAVARLRGFKRAQRVAGPDVLLALCDRGRGPGLRHYFYGGKVGVPEELAERLSERYPGLIVVGTESPPFRALTAEEDEAAVARINAANPSILWVGLGAPKQELWAESHEARLTVPLILPVGAAFDFYSGRVRRAPQWMQRAGLEWLFRLASEPRRLFKRYVVTNSRFVYLVVRESLSSRH